MISIYSNLTDNNISLRRLEAMERYNKLIQWGRKHPVAFIERIFKIQLLDYQKYTIEGTWPCQYAVWLWSRNAGKTFDGAIYLMARALLFPKMKICILSISAKQANETFKKLEDIAKRNISSIVGSTEVFANELIRSNANSDGFTHGQKGHECQLFNGSVIKTIVGTEKTVLGERSNLNFYDEAGNIGPEFFTRTEPFATQSKDFKTGSGLNAEILPKDIPNQLIYSSSAEDVNTVLYQRYKECAIKMMQGIPGYFCVDINCEIPLHPTLNGQKYPPLLTQDKIDQAMRENEAKAMREYYNLFDKTGGTDAMVKRYEITRNEKDYLPEYEFRPIADKSIDRHYAICFDPAAQLDNSFALVGEVYKDPKLGWRGRIVNGVNLIDRLPDGTKKPLRTNEQLQIIRQMIVNYNGNNPEYQNCQLIVDIGAGGGGRTYCERLWEDWTDHEGQLHRGVIDSTDPDASRQMDKYPHAVDCCRMVEPKKWRQQMFGWLCELIQQDLITFPCCLPKNHELELEEKIKTLTQEEIYSYVELDLMKEEVVNFIKEKSPTTGQVMYHLPHNIIRKMHDDRAYCLALFAWHIMTLRNDEIYGDTTVATDYDYLLNYTPSHKTIQNPFADRTNPFGRK